MRKKDYVIVKCKVCQHETLGIRGYRWDEKNNRFAFCPECSNDYTN